MRYARTGYSSIPLHRICLTYQKFFQQLQAAALIADDIMDGSETRRGRSCWYRVPSVGLSAVNDAFLLENIVYEILNRFFKEKEYYSDIVRLVQQTIFRTILGQSVDTRLGLEKNIDE